jgi:hypothetical protein
VQRSELSNFSLTEPAGGAAGAGCELAAAIATGPGMAQCGPAAKAGVALNAVAAARIIRRIETSILVRGILAERPANGEVGTETGAFPAALNDVPIFQHVGRFKEEIAGYQLQPWIAGREKFI